MNQAMAGTVAPAGAATAAAVRQAGATGVSGQPVPLTFLRSGDAARVVRVRGKGEVHHHLENLGFVEGAPLSVVSEQGGNLIVQIKGASVALDRSIASKIIAA